MTLIDLNLHDIFNPITILVLGNIPMGDTVYKSELVDWAYYFSTPASPIMCGIMDLHDFVMVYLTFIVFFVTFTLLVILKSSTIKEDEKDIKKYYKIKSIYDVKFDHNTLLETTWILVPSMILFTIAIPSFVILYAMDIIPEHDFSIKVIGHQWYWSYEYIMENFTSFTTMNVGRFWSMHFETEDLYRYSFDSYMIPTDELKFNHQCRLLDTTNPLVIPVLKYASLTITSVDVIHSFAVPTLGIKVDAVPGRLNTIALYIMKSGHYYGQCSELCGVNHGFMPIEIYAVDLIGFSIYKAALASNLLNSDLITDVVNSNNTELANNSSHHPSWRSREGGVVYWPGANELNFLKMLEQRTHLNFGGKKHFALWNSCK